MILALLGAAFASPLDDLATEAAIVEQARNELGQALETRGGFDTRNREAQLFDTAALAFMIGDPAEAAMGFRVFLSLGSDDPTLVHAAEYLLPQSFEQMGFFEQAAEAYERVASSDHPLRDDALAMLVRLRAEVGPPEAFAEVYERAASSERILATPELTYVLGKARYDLGELDEADRVLAQIPPSSSHGVRSAYLRAVIRLRADDVEEARKRFEQIASLAPTTAAETEAWDLAQLAVARIDFDRGDHPLASDGYAALAGRASVLDATLVETLWTQVALEDWGAALLSFGYFHRLRPDHPDAGRMRLLEGHVLYRMGRLDEAEVAYDRVAGLFDSVIARIELLDLQDPDTLPLLRDPATTWTAGAGLPPRWALDVLGDAPGLERSLAMWSDGLWVGEQIDEAAELAQEVADALSNGGAIGRFQIYRQEADDQLASLVQLRLRVLLDEVDQLVSQGGVSRRRARELAEPIADELARQIDAGAERAERYTRIGALRGDRRSLRAQLRLREIPETRVLLNVLEAELAALEAQRKRPVFDEAGLAAIAAFREPVLAVVPPSITADAHEALYDLIDLQVDITGRLRERIDQEEVAARLSIESTLAAEVRALGAMEGEVDQVAERVAGVWQTSAERAVAHVEERMADARMQALVGLGDIAWQRLLDVRDEMDALREERQEELDDLERRFRLLRTRGQYDLQPDAPSREKGGFNVVVSP